MCLGSGGHAAFEIFAAWTGRISVIVRVLLVALLMAVAPGYALPMRNTVFRLTKMPRLKAGRPCFAPASSAIGHRALRLAGDARKIDI